jgi:hypothetical protein
MLTVTRRLRNTSPDLIYPQVHILPKYRILHADGYPTVVSQLTRLDIPSLTPDKFSSEMNFSTATFLIHFGPEIPFGRHLC